MRQHLKLIAFTLIALSIFLVPQSAHAWPDLGSLVSLGSITGDAITSLLGSVLDLITRALIDSISVLGNLLQTVLNLQLNDGGAVVYTTWRILRDLCNMAFILVIILVAFATIFDSWEFKILKPYTISRSVITGFLTAAILLNFSLAIGQAVALVSNQATLFVLGILPKNIGSSIAQQANLAATAFSEHPKYAPPLPNVDPAALSQSQKDMLAAWTSGAGNSAATTLAFCLKDGDPRGTPRDKDYCFQKAQRIALNNNSVANNPVALRAAVDQENAAKSPAPTMREILQKTYTAFLVMVLFTSFLVVFAFAFIRIPAIWILLAISPLAWTSHAFPGQSKLSEWWKQFMAWNLFSPIYLFTIYFGLFALSNLGQLMGGVRLEDSPVLVYLSDLLTYSVIGSVMIGGTAAALKASFLGGTKAGEYVKSISGKLGVNSEYGAAGTVARLLGEKTGVTATYEARKAKIEQATGDAVARLRGRLPFLQTQAESIAENKAKMGVRGADKEYEALMQKRIQQQQLILQAPFDKRMKDLENDLARATTDKKKLEIKDKIKDLRDGQAKRLGGAVTGGNRDAAFAAGEILLKKGELSPQQMMELRKGYAKLSPLAREGYEKRLQEAAKGGKNKAAAIEALANMKLIKDERGNALDPERALLQNINSLNAEDWLTFDKAKGGVFSPSIQKKQEEWLSKPENLEAVLNKGNAEQAQRLMATATDIAHGKAAKEDVDRSHSQAITEKKDRERFGRAVERARQRSQQAEAAYNRKNTEQNLDKWKQSEITLKEAEEDLTEYIKESTK